MQEFKHSIGFVARYRSPLECQAALAGDYVLRRAATNEAHVECSVGRIEIGMLFGLQLLSDSLDSGNQPCGAKDSGCAKCRVGAVTLTPTHDDLRQTITLPGAYWLQRSRFANNTVTGAQRSRLSKSLSANQTNFLVRGEN